MVKIRARVSWKIESAFDAGAVPLMLHAPTMAIHPFPCVTAGHVNTENEILELEVFGTVGAVPPVGTHFRLSFAGAPSTVVVPPSFIAEGEVIQ